MDTVISLNFVILFLGGEPQNLKKKNEPPLILKKNISGTNQ